MKRTIATIALIAATATASSAQSLDTSESAKWLKGISQKVESGSLTNMQRDAYLKTLSGGNVSITFQVGDVIEGSFWSGSVSKYTIKSKRMDSKMYVFCLTDDESLAASLNRGTRVTCTGRVKDVTSGGFWLQTDVLASSVTTQ